MATPIAPTREVTPQPAPTPTPSPAPPQPPRSRFVYVGKVFKLFRPLGTRLRRVPRNGGVIFATIASSVLAGMAYWQAFNVAHAGGSRLLTWVGLGTLAFATGIGSTYPAFRQSHRSHRTNDQHAALRERILPMLYEGMEEIVQRWATDFTEGVEMAGEMQGVQVQLDSTLELQLHVFVKIDGHHRIVASSVEKPNPVRRLELGDDEGMIAPVYDQHTAVVAVLNDDFVGTLFSPNRNALGAQPPLRPKNAQKCDPRTRWIYATPVYDNRANRPWSDRPLGVLAVDGLNSTSSELYFRREFQEMAEYIASLLAPFLNAHESLLEAGVVHEPDDTF